MGGNQVPDWIDDERRKREITNARPVEPLGEVTALFLAIDPVGINFETNTDEYEPEVGLSFLAWRTPLRQLMRGASSSRNSNRWFAWGSTGHPNGLPGL